MTENPFLHRLSLISGRAALDALGNSLVLVFGAGGVGSWCAEALVRSGIGKIEIIDYDTVSLTNINRQIQATPGFIGKPKAEILAARLSEINPQAKISFSNSVFTRENAGQFNIKEADYVIDAIDSLKHKLDLIEIVSSEGSVPPCSTRLFSSMGAALKLDPSRLKYADIWETRGCPLARLVRAGLRKRGFCGHFVAVYSDERLPPQEGIEAPESRNNPGQTVKGSAVTVTAAAGLILASLVIRDVCAKYGVGSSPLDRLSGPVL